MTRPVYTGDFSLDLVLDKIKKNKPITADEKAFLAASKEVLEHRTKNRDFIFGRHIVDAVTEASEKVQPTNAPAEGAPIIDQLSDDERAQVHLAIQEIVARRGQS